MVHYDFIFLPRYDVHHRNKDSKDVSLTNLVVLKRELHKRVTLGLVKLERPPVGWGHTALW